MPIATPSHYNVAKYYSFNWPSPSIFTLNTKWHRALSTFFFEFQLSNFSNEKNAYDRWWIQALGAWPYRHWKYLKMKALKRVCLWYVQLMIKKEKSVLWIYNEQNITSILRWWNNYWCQLVPTSHHANIICKIHLNQRGKNSNFLLF